MNPFGVKKPWGANEAILGQVIITEYDCKLQFFKKLKYSETVPETVHEVYPSTFICDHHYHHLLKYFLQLERTLTWINGSSVKSISLS